MGMTEMASRMIARFGQPGILRRAAKSGDPWAPTQVETDKPITAAVLEYEQAERDGTLIRDDDLRALVSVEGLDVTPTTADRLIVGGVEYSIARIAQMAPDGMPRFYDMLVRR